MRQIRFTVSGSFHRHLDEIQKTVAELKSRNARVLSPEQPTIVDALDGFVFVASDRHRSVKLVQDRHLASIAESDFVWLENCDGHVGQSASFELGFAAAIGIPVFSNSLPTDLTLRQYVRQVASIETAIALTKKTIAAHEVESPSLLVDPIAATEIAATGIGQLREMLTRSSGANVGGQLQADVTRERAKVVKALRLPVMSRG